MKRFDSFAMVDWSGGNDTGPTPRKDAVWFCAVANGLEQEPVYLRNRQDALDWLTEFVAAELDEGRRVMLGFDFPFGYPEGFAEEVVGGRNPLKLWDWFAENLLDTPTRNNRFELAGQLNARWPGIGPFWFNGMARDIPNLPRKGRARTHGYGLSDRRRVERHANGSFTCWQMGGVGAVGGQVMTGMATLSKLRTRFPGQIAVWPFEPLTRPVALVEIWPSLIAGAVAMAADPIRDRAQVRLVARALAGLSDAAINDMLAVEAPEEGWILGVGYERELERAACRS